MYMQTLWLVFFTGLTTGGIALQGSFYTLPNIWRAAVTPADQLAYLPSGETHAYDG